MSIRTVETGRTKTGRQFRRDQNIKSSSVERVGDKLHRKPIKISLHRRQKDYHCIFDIGKINIVIFPGCRITHRSLIVLFKSGLVDYDWERLSFKWIIGIVYCITTKKGDKEVF